MATTEIREGFLCPICLKDLGGVADLQDHFEEAHSEDKAVLNQLKGLFGKAKRKILGKEFEDEASYGPSNGGVTEVEPLNLDGAGIDPTLWEPQEIGETRIHTDTFKRVRDARIDRFVVETNKLLIRLDKLTSNDSPTEPNKRKAFEKSVVAWAPDAHVNLCTSCGKSFNITRRRHHCRLCGGIICNSCSQFLPFSYAIVLTAPVVKAQGERPQRQGSKKKMTNPSFRYEGEGFHRSSSNSSLNSMLSPEGEPHIRTCGECRILLERRDQQIEQRNYKPPICQIYERMRLYMDEAEQHLPKFFTMAESLSAGETTYNLRDAQMIRMKVMKLYENIDQLSKRIAVLGLDAPDPPPPRVLLLQRAIRTQASNFMQENLLGLQSLPNEEEVEKAREAKRLEIQRRVEAERRAAADREQRRRDESKRQTDSQSELKKTPVKETLPMSTGVKRPSELKQGSAVGNTGWKPIQLNQKYNDDDPMVQQMNIIRGYIRQARDAGKQDEVKMLEANLKELQSEYWRQNQVKSPSNPFGESTDNETPTDWDIKPVSTNPFGEDNYEEHSNNPFEEKSTNPFEESPDSKNPFL